MTRPASDELIRAASYLKSQPYKQRDGYSLVAMKQGYECVGSPLSSTTSVLVGGTNGKGTTAGMLYMLLRELGYKVGLYSSPHLESLAERCEISSHKIVEADLFNMVLYLERTIDQPLFHQLSSFELMTLSSFCLMAEHNVDVAIVEVGMGGEFDATNVLQPTVSVITSIGLDHTQQLGNTIIEIAQTKSGIRRCGMPLVLGVRAHFEPELKVFWRSLKHNPLYLVCQEQIHSGSYPGWLPSRHGLVSSVIKENYHLAQKVIQVLSGLPGVLDAKNNTLTCDHTQRVCHSLPNVLRGRGQWLTVDQYTFYLDTAHNYQALTAAISWFQSNLTSDHDNTLEKSVACLGLLQDKEPQTILSYATSKFDRIFLFQSLQPRAYRPPFVNVNDDHHSQHLTYNWSESFSEAMNLCLNHMAEHKISACFVGGSFNTVALFIKYIRKRWQVNV
ncbi:MAG: Mur ligase family protein [Proteobacteria bacterium]|nr:Mur ligase family protein [Pseudomonadota bacterium]